MRRKRQSIDKLSKRKKICKKICIDPNESSNHDPRENAMQRRVVKRLCTVSEFEARMQQQPAAQELEAMKFVSRMISGDRAAEFERDCVVIRDGKPALNYSGLAAHFFQSSENIPPSMKVPVTEEQVAMFYEDIKVCVRKIRKAFAAKKREMEESMESITKRVQSLFDNLHQNFKTLTAGGTSGADALRIRSAHETLNLERAAAARILPAEYGAGIRDADIEEVEKLLLNFARKMGRRRGKQKQATSLEAGLTRLLKLLSAYDANAIADDFALVDAACRVVINLVGENHLIGLFAQLNVIVVLRDAMPWNEYVDEMARLAAAARQLHGDVEVKRFARWMGRHLSSEDRLPSPNRFASYCLGNLVFRSLDSFLTSNRADFHRVRAAIAEVRRTDGKFEQIRWWELALAATNLKLTGDPSDMNALRRRFSPAELESFFAMILKHFDYESVHNAIAEQLAPAPAANG